MARNIEPEYTHSNLALIVLASSPLLCNGSILNFAPSISPTPISDIRRRALLKAREYAIEGFTFRIAILAKDILIDWV